MAAERTELGHCKHTPRHDILDPWLHAPVAGGRMLVTCDLFG